MRNLGFFLGETNHQNSYTNMTNQPTENYWQTIDLDGRPALHRRFDFKGFKPVCALIQALMSLADAHDHHPDVRFGYNYCDVYWTTHSEGGLSDRDHKMAALTDTAAKNLD